VVLTQPVRLIAVGGTRRHYDFQLKNTVPILSVICKVLHAIVSIKCLLRFESAFVCAHSSSIDETVRPKRPATDRTEPPSPEEK
jgi:hypothetical protein